MSANVATHQRVRPEPIERPYFEVISTKAQRRARPRVTYAITAVVCLITIIAAQLLLAIAVSDGAYHIDALQDQRKELIRDEQRLSEELDLLGSSQNLAVTAASQGMVPGSSSLFLDLNTGGVAAAPSSTASGGCGAQCSPVANSLVSGTPLVPSTATQGTLVAVTQPPQPPVHEPAVEQPDTIPVPVTH